MGAVGDQWEWDSSFAGDHDNVDQGDRPVGECEFFWQPMVSHVTESEKRPSLPRGIVTSYPPCEVPMWGTCKKTHSRLDYSCPGLIMYSHTRGQRTVSSPSVLTLHQRGKCWVKERVWEKAGLISSPLDCGSQRIDSEWVPEVRVRLHVITWPGLNLIHPNETALNNVSAWKTMESD